MSSPLLIPILGCTAAAPVMHRRLRECIPCTRRTERLKESRQKLCVKLIIALRKYTSKLSTTIGPFFHVAPILQSPFRSELVNSNRKEFCCCTDPRCCCCSWTRRRGTFVKGWLECEGINDLIISKNRETVLRRGIKHRFDLGRQSEVLDTVRIPKRITSFGRIPINCWPEWDDRPGRHTFLCALGRGVCFTFIVVVFIPGLGLVGLRNSNMLHKDMVSMVVVWLGSSSSSSGS